MRRLLTILTLALSTSLLVAAPARAVPEDKIVVEDPAGDVAGGGPEATSIDVAKVTYRYNIIRDGGLPPRQHLGIQVRFDRALWHRPRRQVVTTRMGVDGTTYVVEFTSTWARLWRIVDGERQRVRQTGRASVGSRGAVGYLGLSMFPPAFAGASQVDWFRTTMHLTRTSARDTTDRTGALEMPFPE